MCYAKDVMTRYTKLAAIILSLSFIFVSGALAYNRNSLLHRFDMESNTRETEKRIAEQRADFYRQAQQRITDQLTVKEAELESKTTELNTKKVELDKASQELTQKIKELNSAKSQLTANAAELSKLRGRPPLFSFKVESSSIANVEQKKEDVKQLVIGAYDAMVEIYSQPYLYNSYQPYPAIW